MMTSRTLTGYTIADTYNFVVDWASKHKGNTPSCRQIGVGCNFSMATAHACVQALIKQGYLERIDDELCVVHSDFALHAKAKSFNLISDGKFKGKIAVDIFKMKAIPLNTKDMTTDQLAALGIIVGPAIDKQYQEATYPAGWLYEEIEGTNSESYLLVDEKGNYRAVLYTADGDTGNQVTLTFLEA